MLKGRACDVDTRKYKSNSGARSPELPGFMSSFSHSASPEGLHGVQELGGMDERVGVVVTPV